MRRTEIVVAAAAVLVFADATIVTLALPSVLVQLHTTVEGVAAVLGVYTASLGLAALPAERLLRRMTPGLLAPAAFAVFAVASLACAAAPDLTLLLVGRAAQGLAGAAVLAVAGDFLDATSRGRQAWVFVIVLSGAVGPVLGGALTQAFTWRAIFVAQAPIPLLAALAVARSAPREVEVARASATPKAGVRATLALGLVSAALTALLFGLVLLLVAGWALHPLTAALAVSLVPVAAFVGSRIGGPGEVRTAIGATLVAAGIGMLAFLPTDQIRWLVVPEVLAGIGMGLSLTPLLEHLVPESSSRRRASNVAVRHLGTTLALLVLAPVLAHDLSSATEQAKLRTVALVLDAEIDPVRKLELGPRVAAAVHSENPLASVRSGEAQARAGIPRDERHGFAELARGLDNVFVGAANDAFRRAFVLAAFFALVAAGLFVRAAPIGAAVALAASLAFVGAQVIVDHIEAPAQVRIADPCRPRPRPKATGIAGSAQSVALTALDKAACFLGSSREELVLALASKREGEQFKRRHGVDPHSIRGLLDTLHRF
jgi:predicted MFS family arabinose efflux permease